MPKMRPYGKVKEIMENGKVVGYQAGNKGFKYMIENGDKKKARDKAEAQLRALLKEEMEDDDMDD